jgi:DNA-3-methyladenine glycosylase
MTNINKPLQRKFFLGDTLKIARELLGKIIVKHDGKNILKGKIVETEAYIGEHDPACHAFQKFTDRSSVLYEKGGTIYVYFVYGNYFCFNIVTGKEGTGDAVLIRAVEPLEGLEIMKNRRPKAKNTRELTNGPSKFCMAFGLDGKFNRNDITGKDIYITSPAKREKFEIASSKRIGLNVGVDFPYRFFIKNNEFVTKHKFNNTI